MPDNGSGVYDLPGASFPYVTGQVVDATKQTANASDIATAMSNRICKDGQTTMTANIPMGGFKLTGLGAAAVAADAVSLNSTLGITLPGTGNRFIADMTNATFANRFAFQTSTANGATALMAIPSGTGVFASFQVYNNAIPTNSARAYIAITDITASLASGIVGTGTQLPLSILVGSFTPVTYNIDGTATYTGTHTFEAVATTGFMTAGAVPFKHKILTGTTAAGSSGTVTAAHGLTASKILSVDFLVVSLPGDYVGPDKDAGFLNSYSAYFDATNIKITNGSTATDIYSRTYTAFITYTA